MPPTPGADRMRVLVVGNGDLDGVLAAFMWTEPDIPELPLKYMVVPADADAGHLGAMAQYMTLGQDSIVFVHEEAMELLGLPARQPGPTEPFELADAAARRGVSVTRMPCVPRVANGLFLLLTSPDRTINVEINFPAWSGDLADTKDAFELLAQAMMEYDPALVD